MKFNKKLLSIIMFLLMVIYLASCGIIPESPKGSISGRVLIPSSELTKDITGWVPAANATVTIVDAEGLTHTVTTDENGYYNFDDISVNPNTVITATVALNGNTVILKNVIPQSVAANEDYDTGDMTPESTALALVVELLIAAGEDPSDINLEEIKLNKNFSTLVDQVTTILEEDGDVTTDPDIFDIINELINPPTLPTPSTTGPAIKQPVYNQTNKKYYKTIQSAINASNNGDVIIVSKGTYKENIIFDNKNITLKSSDPADPAIVAATIIDGQDLDSVVKFLNGDISTIEGFTIQNGNEPSYGGGGIFVSGSSPVIRYNIIGDNNDDEVYTGNNGYYGGGICVVEDSETPKIYENIIIGNTGILGGGICIDWGSPLVENNTIKENVSDSHGGGISIEYSKYDGKNYCPVIRGNIIEYNQATNGNGGGIDISQEGVAILENNTISNNEATLHGGGIYIYYKSDADIKENNIIKNNKAGHHGGGIYIYSNDTIYITTNTIINNIANIDSNSYSGGGIYVNEAFMTSTPVIGGTDSDDTSNFNTICGNSPDQVDPDNYPNNDYCNAVNLSVSPAGYGTVIGDGNYFEDDEVYIEATAGEGYYFINWTDDDNGNMEVSTNNPYSFTMPSGDVNYTANFTPKIYNLSTGVGYNYIQDAIDAAGSDNVIILYPGTYYENIIFTNKEITVKSSNPTDPTVLESTIIDGGGEGSVVTFNGDYVTTLEGVTIQNGSATTGGGILIAGSSPIIRNTYIRNNNATIGGGGIYVSGLSEPTIENNTIDNNTASAFGGGLALWETETSFDISNNVVQNNETDGSGGAMYIKMSYPTISGNTIQYNKADYGGGLYMHSNNDSTNPNFPLELSGNTIQYNKAESSGGGGLALSNTDAFITNNTIDHNEAPAANGGGIYISNGSSPKIIDNNINNNAAIDGGGIWVYPTGCSPIIGGSDETDTEKENFNLICGNSINQVVPNDYPNNYIFTSCNMIGETGPAGGLVFYDKGFVSDGWRYLEVHPTDQSTGYVWNDGSYIEGTSAEIGTGEANTNTIVADSAGHDASAALLCYDLVYNDFDDWFLPSIDELNLMYTNLKLYGLGNFSNSPYWSSTEESQLYAWYQYFGSGSTDNGNKNDNNYVRAVRSF